MRYYISFAALLLFAASCQTPRMGRLETARPKPFVELANGTVVNATDVERTTNFFGASRVLADNKVYRGKTVAQYSDGSETYVHTHNSAFAQKVVDGKINVYREDMPYFSFRYSYPSTWRINNGPQRHRIRIYVQENGSKKIGFLNYKNLLPMVPTGTPAYTLLQKYNVTDKMTVLGSCMGTGIYTAGIIMSINGAISNGPNANINTGVALICTGLGVLATSTIIRSINQLKLFKVVGRVNGVPDRPEY